MRSRVLQLNIPRRYFLARAIAISITPRSNWYWSSQRARSESRVKSVPGQYLFSTISQKLPASIFPVRRSHDSGPLKMQDAASARIPLVFTRKSMDFLVPFAKSTPPKSNITVPTFRIRPPRSPSPPLRSPYPRRNFCCGPCPIPADHLGSFPCRLPTSHPRSFSW